MGGVGEANSQWQVLHGKHIKDAVTAEVSQKGPLCAANLVLRTDTNTPGDVCPRQKAGGAKAGMKCAELEK